MTLRNLRDCLFQQEDINFLLTNRIPRIAATRFMGWFSKIEQPMIRDFSLFVWTMFSDLDLSEARKSSFKSVHDCFIRELKPGARPIDPDPRVLCSPCDAIVGQCGRVNGRGVFQAKGFPYKVEDLLGNQEESSGYEGGIYVTLRLTSSMYHRLHSPSGCRVRRVTYISGDTWNVNPIALKRVERLFCKNERAVIRCELSPEGGTIVLVAVAAVLVASIRLHCLGEMFHPRYKGPNEFVCDVAYERGEELGWFQHGSTIIVFAPRGFSLVDGIQDGVPIRMGERLLKKA